MNSRELTLVSTATVFGALASALAIRFLFTNPKKHYPKLDSSKNGVVSRKCSSQSPFDPSKRKGLVPEMSIIHKGFSFYSYNNQFGSQISAKMPTFSDIYIYIYYSLILGFYIVFVIEDIWHGMIISWRLHFCQLKDPKTLTGRSYSLLFL